MKDEIVGYIYKTTDYSKFNFLEENREVTENRANKIRRSMQENGVIFNPINVNDCMSIIDGQGRFTALRELGEPVCYFVSENTGAKECRVLNACMTNWSLPQFVKNLSLSGNTNYINLERLMEKYPKLPIAVLMDFLCGYNDTYKIQPVVLPRAHNNCSQALKDGRLLLGDDLANKVIPHVNRCVSILDAVEQHGSSGIRRSTYRVISFILLTGQCDYDRLLSNIIRYGMNFNFGLTTTPKLLEEFSKVYNFDRSKKSRVYFEYLFKTL